MRSFCLSSLFLTLLLTSASSAQDKKADPRERLETAVPECIRLLEAKEYKKFLETFAAPEDLKKFTKEAGSVEKFAEAFGKEKAATLLKILKAIKDVKPTLDRDEKKATFKFKDIEGAPRDMIAFTKIDKFWYIQN